MDPWRSIGNTWMTRVHHWLLRVMVLTYLSISGVMEPNLQRVVKACLFSAVALSSMTTGPTSSPCSCAEKFLHFISREILMVFVTHYYKKLPIYRLKHKTYLPDWCVHIWGCKHWFGYYVGLPGIGPLAASESSAGRSGQRRGNIRNLCMHRQRPADIELEDLYTYIYI